MQREQLREIGIAILVILILFSAAVVLFFAEGGEIYGFNHDPNGPSKPLQHSKYEFEVVYEEIVPIYDGTEIKTIELWEMPPREILEDLIYGRMAYIPPITGHLVTIFISALGLAFIILYRRPEARENRQEDGRPEQILASLTKNPGRSLQKIADDLDMPRSTLRYYLQRMQKKGLISETGYRERTYYFAVGKTYTDMERLLYIILSQEKEERALTIIRNHPGITKRELSDHLRLSLTACDWYLQRFFDDGLLMIISDGVHNHYRLTDEATDACEKICAG